MKNIKLSFCFFVQIVEGILLALIPFFIVGVCKHESEDKMLCFYSATLVVAIGIILILFSFFTAYLHKGETIVLSHLVTIVMNVFVFLIPYALVGGCKMSSMKCNRLTFPVIYVVSAVFIVANIIGMVINRKNEKKDL